MTNQRHQKSAASGTTREQHVVCGSKKCVNSSLVVYSEFSGLVLKVTFLGGQWWATTPGERLQPLEQYFDGEEISFRYLCEGGGKVGALALARLLGHALENPEYGISETLQQRVDALKRLGVRLDVKDEPLTVELTVFDNAGKSHRRGKYSAWCSLVGDSCTMLFDIDGFSAKNDAELWAFTYFEFLQDLGVDLIVV